MLLRASGQAIGEEAELDGAVGVGDGGVPHGAALVAYAEAASRGSEDLVPAREALGAAVGAAGLIRAAATVGIFNGLVRVADGIGIPLDDAMRAASGAFRQELGLNAYSGASNTDLEAGGETSEVGPLPDLLGR